jgi:ankyrin repeat protein
MQPLLDAIKTGDLARVQDLLRGDPSLAGTRKNDVSVVRLALYVGHREIADAFVLAGAPLDLFDAAAIGDPNAVEQRLTEDPARVKSFSADGHSPLGLACFFGHSAAAMLLIERGADVNVASHNNMKVAPLHSAVARQSRNLVELLLARGADVNAKQQAGYTPLHGAAAAGERELCELLLRHGADRAAQSDDGKTPADLARDRGHATIAELIA